MHFARRHVRVTLFAVSSLLFSAGAVNATVIGPVVNSTYTGADNGGERVNVDINNPILLIPGTYTATNFSFFAVNTSVNTTPFLAVSTSSSSPPASFNIIASGSTITTGPVTGTNAPQTVPFGGTLTTSTFTLATATTVYAGVASGTAGSTTDNNSIGFINSGVDDHNNPGNTQFTPAQGGSIPSFTNPNLGRTYGFDITVTPEPASTSILAMAALGLLARRRWLV